MLNIGYDNSVAADHVDGIVRNDGAAIRKYRAMFKDTHKLIDATCGHKARSIIIMESGNVFLSAIVAETLKKRMEKES